jgi:hypothetical protein
MSSDRDENMSGTFARLYDLQEELRKTSRPVGRPPKKIQRKPTSVYFSKQESSLLGKLHLSVNEHFTVNRSELVGVAIEALATLLASEGGEEIFRGGVGDLETFRRRVCEIIKS